MIDLEISRSSSQFLLKPVSTRVVMWLRANGYRSADLNKIFSVSEPAADVLLEELQRAQMVIDETSLTLPKTKGESDRRISSENVIGGIVATVFLAMIVTILYFALKVFAWLFIPEKVDPKVEAANRARAEAEAAEDKRKGFHCLSFWDGSHPGVVRQVKMFLRDPDSFEHDTTSITPVDSIGKHELYMRYRARNGFGGMTIGSATAEIDHETCNASNVHVRD